MEVNTNLNAGGIGGPVPPRRAAAAPKAAATANFTSSDALEQAVKNLPSSRSDAVERARTLTSDVNYPPLETIRKISRLLAIKIDSAQE